MFVSPSPIPGTLRSLMVRPGREIPTTPPLGLEAKSLKNGVTHHWNFQGPNKQTQIYLNGLILIQINSK